MQREQYPETLQRLEHESQRFLDRTLVWLSGGALALSVTYRFHLGGTVEEERLLIGAWFCWGASLASVLFGFIASIRALRTAQDEAVAPEPHVTGGRWRHILPWSDWISFTLFLTGLVLMGAFANSNAGGDRMRENDKEGVAKEEKRDIVGNAFQVPRNIGEKKPPKPEDKPSNDDDQSSDG